MRYTRFGQTALEVSRVCFGTWQFSGDWAPTRRRTSWAPCAALWTSA
jgi:aryl-alcohol dehydrogenase-like predicted oxidoreductase